MAKMPEPIGTRPAEIGGNLSTTYRHQAAGRTRPFGHVRPTRQPIPYCVSFDTVSGDT